MFFRSLLRYIHPHLLVTKVTSQYSGPISVISEFGQLRIWAGGIPQTGGIVDLILRKHLKYYANTQRILLLGLGGGGILKYFRRQFPKSQITAVEIDPIMVDLARTYFDIDHLDVTVHVAEAKDFICKSTPAQYDAILVDCYLGKQIPESLQSIEFLTQIHTILSPTGVATFNRLNDQSNQSSNELFLTHLNKIFPFTDTTPNYSNLLVIAKKGV